MEAKEVLENVVSDDARAQKLLAGATLLISGIAGLKSNTKTAILKTLAGGFLVYKGLEGLDWNEVIKNLESTQKNNPLLS
jgi:uncharacterized membrane protein